MKTLFFSILALLALSACANSDITYSSLPEGAPTPKPGMAQLVIYRPASFKYILRPLHVELGSATCELSSGSFFLRDVPASSLRITATLWGLQGASRIMLKPIAGQLYYIKLSVNNDKFNAVAMGEDDGLLTRSTLSDHSGPFNIAIEDEKAALTELQALKMSAPCP